MLYINSFENTSTYMDRVLESSFLVNTHLRTNRARVLQKSFESSNNHADIKTALLSRRVQKNERYIDLMFYTPAKNDVIINRVVAYATKQSEYNVTGEETFSEFAHVEISFHVGIDNKPFEANKFMGFSITQNSKVYFKLKYWRPEYSPLRIVVSEDTYCKLFKLCMFLAVQKIKFDSVGMYTGTIAPEQMVNNRSRHEHGTFCSKIITEVLQECDVGSPAFKLLLPHRSTPSLLYKCLKT